MIAVRPKDINDLKRVIDDALKNGKLVYISATPCSECEEFEALLETLLTKDELNMIIKVDIPDDDEIVNYVLNDLGIPGSPTVITPNTILDDFDTYELAVKVREYIRRK